MNAGIYARVSTREQMEDGFSIPAQLRAGREYCASHDWSVVEYVDEGLSAAKESAAQRPQFRRLLDDVEAHRIDVVVVHKLDRFSRNLVVTMQSLARIERAGGAFVSLTEQIDLSTPTGRLMLGVFALFAQFYSDNLASEVSKGRRERVLQGLPNGDLPFGYTSTGNPKAPPVSVPSEEKLVREAYRRYATGTQSAHVIAGWLNDQGVWPRSKRGRTKFTKATVLDMLSNPFYAGRVRYHCEEFPGARKHLVDDALFARVTRMRARRRRLAPALKAHPARTYMLRGIGRCVACGRGLVCNASRAGRRYRDTSREKYAQCAARRHSVKAEVIEQQIGLLINRLDLPSDWQAEILERVSDPSEAETKRRRTGVKERLSRLNELYLDGDIGKLRYQVERATLGGELEGLDAALAVADDPVDRVSVLRGYADIWDAADEEERAGIVQAVLEEVYVDLDRAEVVIIKPRSQFLPLMRALWRDKLLHGDPERIRTADLHLDRVACLTATPRGRPPSVWRGRAGGNVRRYSGSPLSPERPYTK